LVRFGFLNHLDRWYRSVSVPAKVINKALVKMHHQNGIGVYGFDQKEAAIGSFVTVPTKPSDAMY
jgi:hypothetical protein